jgi:hypothetical protein
LKRSEWFVGGVGLAFFACVFVWGNSHRERVTVLVLPTIALTAFVVTRAAWRLRKALSESERKFYKATKSE